MRGPPCTDFSISVSLSGMMVEVLGTVLGTAIQGQIVGGSTNCPDEPDFPGGSNSTNTSRVTLDDTVRVLSLSHCFKKLYFQLSGTAFT